MALTSFADRVVPAHPVLARCLTARPTAVLRGRVRPGSVGYWLDRAHARVREVLRANGIPTAGPAFARFLSAGPEVRIEAGFPVPDAIADLGDVVASGLPGGTVVVATHEGRFAPDALYEALDRWLSGHGFVEAGAHWEVYLTDDGPGGCRTEVVVPYRLA